MSFHTYNAAGEMREAAPTRCPVDEDDIGGCGCFVSD